MALDGSLYDGFGRGVCCVIRRQLLPKRCVVSFGPSVAVDIPERVLTPVAASAMAHNPRQSR